MKITDNYPRIENGIILLSVIAGTQKIELNYYMIQ